MESKIDAVFVGGPKLFTDSQGEWRSSIDRQSTLRRVEVTAEGIVGDQVTQPYHGSADAALCAHLADHYRFWQEGYNLSLPAGTVGENLTLGSLLEEDVCAGDVVRLGSVLAQVSGPRVPCASLARRIGQRDWVRRTVRENRTGFYLRVLEPGSLQAGDPWLLQQRFNPEATIPIINRCMYLAFDPVFAGRMQHMTGLGEWWRTQAAEKLQSRSERWTSRLSE